MEAFTTLKVIAILLVLLLILIVPPILFIRGISRAWRQQRLKRFLLWSTVAALGLMLAIKVWDWRAEKRFVRNLVGMSIPLRHPIFELNTEYAKNGDGGTLEAFSIPSDALHQFNPPMPGFFNLPKTRDSEDGWIVTKWRSGPVRPEDMYVLESALSYNDYHGSIEWPTVKAMQTISEAANKKTSYYAYNCNGVGPDFPPDKVAWGCYIVDFYILDPVEGRIYLLYMKI